ncbi:hypothetical protein [Streptomyces sp. NPDC002187]|uniref:hypothetical protein n=1 Tax=Streptomyces sp. NPDC002187 TaxID=3364637 RepID=UPI00369E9CFD
MAHQIPHTRDFATCRHIFQLTEKRSKVFAGMPGRPSRRSSAMSLTKSIRWLPSMNARHAAAGGHQGAVHDKHGVLAEPVALLEGERGSEVVDDAVRR